MMLGATRVRAPRQRGSMCHALTRRRPTRQLMCTAPSPLPAAGRLARRTRRLPPTMPLPSLLHRRLPLARLCQELPQLLQYPFRLLLLQSPLPLPPPRLPRLRPTMNLWGRMR